MKILLRDMIKTLATVDEALHEAVGRDGVEKYLGKALYEALFKEIPPGAIDGVDTIEVRIEFNVHRKIR